jgi:hypothetical protein
MVVSKRPMSPPRSTIRSRMRLIEERYCSGQTTNRTPRSAQRRPTCAEGCTGERLRQTCRARGTLAWKPSCSRSVAAGSERKPDIRHGRDGAGCLLGAGSR